MRDRLIDLLKYKRHVETSELADYLLENGVIVPPCKVGDTVYTTVCYGSKHGGWKVETSTIVEIRQRLGVNHEPFTEIIEKRVNDKGVCFCNPIPLDRFGKTVFLTREEAERALRKEDDWK